MGCGRAKIPPLFKATQYQATNRKIYIGYAADDNDFSIGWNTLPVNQVFMAVILRVSCYYITLLVITKAYAWPAMETNRNLAVW